MKTEINNENKAKFFALYWGQDIVHHSIESPFLGYFNSLDEEHMYNHGVDYYSLGLKPLSSISDEDAVEVGKMAGFPSFKLKDGVKNQIASLILSYWKDYYIYDYLRSKGYALPWLGLSVEEMVEAGWIKLIEK